MLGAIIGDVAGSYIEVLEIHGRRTLDGHRSYEDRIKILDKNVPLFGLNCLCTDDSILTMAIYDAIVNGSFFNNTIANETVNEYLQIMKDGNIKISEQFIGLLDVKKYGGK